MTRQALKSSRQHTQTRSNAAETTTSDESTLLTDRRRRNPQVLQQPVRRLDAGESLVGGARIARVADELGLLLAMGLVEACKRGRYTVNALGRKYFSRHTEE